ncbi:MAG: AAA family ATPase [Chitinophagales bacterium]
MKKIVLEKIVIKNFKGLRSIEFTFDQLINNIYGANESGKTSTYDAVYWLLFGKDSTERTDFNIQPLEDGKRVDRIDTDVLGYWNVDGVVIKLQRIYKQKWTRPRGTLEEVFSGNETKYFYNDVPMKESEYQAKINDIVTEKYFKLLTNPMFFNSKALKWEDRRIILNKLESNISVDSIIAKIDSIQFKAEIDNLIGAFNQNKTIESYKSQISGQKKTIKEEIDSLPARIDEATKSLPLEIPVFSLVQSEIEKVQKELKSIDESIENRNKAVENDFKRIKKQQEDKFALQTKLQKLQEDQKSLERNKSSDLKTSLENKQRSLLNYQNEISNNNSSISLNNNSINQLVAENDRIRKEWNNVNESELLFNDNDFSCPACNRELDADKIANSKKELTINFNTNKSKKLDEINNIGIKNKERIEELTAKNQELKNLNTEAQNKLTDLQTEIDKLIIEIQTIENTPIAESKEISDLKQEIEKFVIDESPKVDIEDLKLQKEEATLNLDELKKQMALKEVIERTNLRIAELELKQQSSAQELSNLERQEFVIDKYNSEYINAVEESVNKKFKYVRFKMFDQQQNGGEKPTCKTTYKGVPYDDLNTAGKIFAGIDIINGLSNHYQITAPIFLDNRESVTNIPDTIAQVINLVVAPWCEKLTVGTKELDDVHNLFIEIMNQVNDKTLSIETIKGILGKTA